MFFSFVPAAGRCIQICWRSSSFFYGMAQVFHWMSVDVHSTSNILGWYIMLGDHSLHFHIALCGSSICEFNWIKTSSEHTQNIHAQTHCIRVRRDRGRRPVPWYRVAGLSDTMVRSWPAARLRRAEQWSCSPDGEAEGTLSWSVSLAELQRLLWAQTLS